MIEYKYLSNVKKQTIGYGTIEELDKSNLVDSIIQKYKDLGINIGIDNISLYLIIDGKTYDLEESLLNTNGVITVLLSEVAKPDNAAIYDVYEGIIYYFHTNELRHEHNPHIHAKYESQEISIYLNNFQIVGKLNNSAKQNKALKYVKRNHQAILKRWNEIMGI